MTAPVLPELAAIPQLEFAVAGAHAPRNAAAPTVVLSLTVARTAGAPVRSATIAVRVDIAAARRAYDAATQRRLVELFGEPERWDTTLRTFGWGRATVLAGPFDDRTTVELPLSVSCDFDVAANKYLHALHEGEIPLDLMFTGSVLYDVGGRIQAAPIPWDSETSFRLPVSVWRDAMETAFGRSRWLRLRGDVFDRLYEYRAGRSLASWEDTLSVLLEEARWTE